MRYDDTDQKHIESLGICTVPCGVCTPLLTLSMAAIATNVSPLEARV